MSLEHILLGLLETPATGYSLKQEIDEGVRYFWSADLAQIYPTLQSMEKRGWLRSKREASPHGPQRRVYRRTAAGTRQLHRWLKAEPIMGVERFAYIGQLIYLYQLHDLETTLQFMQQLRAKQCTVLRALKNTYKEVEDAANDADKDPSTEAFHAWLSLGLGIQAISARIAWCDAVIPTIQLRLREMGKTTRKPTGEK
jgi:PadR family transcriptional regulator, regulatory protein AphA